MKLKNNYFLLRHGETPYQQKKKEFTYPRPDISPVQLTEEGKEQVKKISQELKKENIDLIYSSDIFRTRQTAQIAARELGLKINFDKRLRDLNLGVYHNKTKKDFYKDFPDPRKRFSEKLKGGESWNEVKERMSEFLEEMEENYQNKNILIVSHGDPLWLLEGVIKGWNEKELLCRLLEKENYFEVGELKKLDKRIFA